MTTDRLDIDVDIDTTSPKSYQVVMLNDDYTTQDFVIGILLEVFRKNQREAKALMLNIHNEGRTIVGIYSYDMAVSKVKATKNLARKASFPLRCLVEEV